MFAIHVVNDAVSIAPGSTALTRILGESSAAMSRVICDTAALVRLCVNDPRGALRPATELMFTMAPRPRSSMCGTVSRTSSNGDEMLKWNECSRSATVVSSNGRDTDPPALFTTMSMPPSSSTVRCTSAARKPRSLTSPGTPRARRPCASTDSATRATSSAVRAVTTTSAPACANSSAVAAPIPLPPPVTIAT